MKQINMENTGSGATMNAGVATPVASSINVSEARSVGEKNLQAEPVSASEEVKTIEPKVQEDQIETADRLIIIAKHDGVDEALEKLAKDDGEDRESVDGVKTKSQQDEHEEADEERKPNLLEKEVHELAAKVEKFAETNADIRKRLEQVEQMNQLAMLTIYEMAQILKKMIEESEEENKQNLLMILAQIIAKMMELMFVPNEEDGVADGQTSEDRQLERMAA